MALYTAQIEKLYVTFFNRPADFSGLAYWEGQMVNTNGNSAVIANAFAASAEYKALYAGKSTAATIETIYQNLFGRAAEPDAIQYWGVRLDNGTFNIGTIANSIAVGAQNLDATTIANKVTAATEFTATLDTTAEILGYETTTNGQAVKDWLKAVTSDAATLTSATTALPALVTTVVAGSNVNPGQTFTLTTGADNFAATTGNDTFNGVSATGANAATDTFGITDVINGGTGTDTLNVAYTGITADATAGALISNVEVFNIRNTASVQKKVNLDASKVVGLTQVNSNLSTGEVAVTKLAAGAAGGLIGNGVLVNGGFEMGYADASSAVTINLAGGVKQTAGVATAGVDGATTGLGILVTAGTAATATINSTGAANTVGGISLAPGTANITGVTINAASNLTITDGAGTADILGWKVATAATNTLTIKGAATSVNVGTLDASVGVVDASGLTAGGVTATIGAVTQKITGGAGNDTITTNGVQTGAVDAGAGTGDRLIVSAAADIAATPAAKFTNFEILRNTAGGATLDVSTVAGITAIELGATGQGAAKMSAVQAAAVTNLADNATMTLALTDATGTSDVLSVVLDGSKLTGATAATTASLTGATITGFETMNVTSSSGTQGVAASGNALAFAAAGNLTALNVAGAYDLAVTTTNITKAVAIASTQTGAAALNVTGNLVKGSTVTTTANADAIVTTAAIAGTTGDFVTYNAGAGNDTITTTLAAINNTSAANGSVKIDGGAGIDTVITDAGTYVDANFQNITNVEKVTFAGAINVTTGGFFDTNFKAGGVTFTDATADGGAIVVDATTFSGKVTTAITQSGAGVAGDSYVIKSGSGDDVIALTTAATLTTGGNIINTGLGNDTVTITAAARGVASVFTVNLGAGNDTLTINQTGAGLFTVTGGTGADTIALGGAVHTGIITFNQGIGDSGTFVKPATNTISTVGFDVITGAVTTLDKIALANTTSSVVTQVTNLSTGTFADDSISQARGTYDAVNKTFVASATGADSLYVYDSTTGATVTLEAVVVVGITGVSTAASGVITII